MQHCCEILGPDRSLMMPDINFNLIYMNYRIALYPFYLYIPKVMYANDTFLFWSYTLTDV